MYLCICSYDICCAANARSGRSSLATWQDHIFAAFAVALLDSPHSPNGAPVS